MRRGRLNAEAPLGLLGETHSVGRRESIIALSNVDRRLKLRSLAPTVSPKVPDQPMGHGANPYRQDHMRAPHPQFFDLDLDLNPDL